MPSIFTHAIAGSALAALGRPARQLPPRFWVLAATSAMLPDADVVTFRLGVPYASVYGHRGLSHSLIAAAVTAAAIVGVFLRDRQRPKLTLHLWAVFAVIIASHGVLDAMTDGGRGIAFFAPFSNKRYFFAWQPIEVSPIGADFISARGVAVLLSEAKWVWLPCLGMLAIGLRTRARRPGRAAELSRLEEPLRDTES
jgi:inner membrane protein